MAETRETFDGPIFQAYFNEPRILWSSVDVGFPFQYNLPQAFPCWPSNFSFVLVTNQYEFAMPFCPHRVCDTVIPTPSCGYLLSTW